LGVIEGNVVTAFKKRAYSIHLFVSAPQYRLDKLVNYSAIFKVRLTSAPARTPWPVHLIHRRFSTFHSRIRCKLESQRMLVAGYGQQGIHVLGMNSDYQPPQDSLVQGEVPLHAGKVLWIDAEVGQIIESLLVPFHRIRQAALVPWSARQHFRVVSLQDGLQLFRRRLYIPGDPIRVKKEHALVDVFSHNDFFLTSVSQFRTQ